MNVYSYIYVSFDWSNQLCYYGSISIVALNLYIELPTPCISNKQCELHAACGNSHNIMIIAHIAYLQPYLHTVFEL